MANDGFIEFLSPNALDELKTASTYIDNLAEKIKTINSFKSPVSPSGADKASRQMIADLKAQEQAIKQATNALIQEEKVKQASINTQIKANAQKKSAIALSAAEQKEAQRLANETNRQALANERLSRAFVQLNNQRTIARNKLQDLIASEKASNSEIRKAQKEFDILDAKVQKANRAVGNFSSNVGNYKSALSGVSNLMGAFGIATGLYLAADIVRNIFNTTKELQSLDLALKNVSGSQEAFASNQMFLSGLAQSYGIEIKGLTKNFTDFLAASKGLLSQNQIEEIFTSVSKSAAAMGLSVEATDSAFLALEQMMSKGTIQAEELKRQLGNALPGAMRAAAMAYMELHPEITKVADAERLVLSEMKKGAIDSATYIPLIVKQFEKLYGIENVNNINTLMAAQNRLSNSWTNLVRSMNESDTSGVSRFFKVILDGLTNIADFTNTLFKDEKQLQKYFKTIGKAEGLEYFNSVMKNIGDTSKENIEAVKQEMLFRERETIRVNEAIIKSEKAKRESIIGGNRALFHLQTKAEEDALVKIGRSAEIIKQIKDSYSNINVPTTTKTESEAQRKARLKAEADELKRLEELRRNAYERRISDLEREKEKIKDLRDLETTSLEDKLFLENAYATKQIQINQEVYDEKIRLAKGNADLEKIALNDLLTSNENALSESLARQQKLKEDAMKSDAQKTKEWYEKNPPMFFMTDEMRKQYEEAQEKIKKLKEEFRNYIQSFGQDFFSNAGFGETFDFFLRMDEEGKTMFEKLDSLADGSVEKFAATFNAIAETAQETFNFINQMSQANFDAEYARLEQQKEVALLFAGESASAREEVERQYEEKRKSIARREAKAKKEMAIFNIAIDTAQAIMSAVAASPLTGGMPWTAIIAAIGALQIGMVAQQQIPQFWKGTDNAPEGYAYTQEKGRELITDKNGKIKSLGSDKGAQMTYLNKGDKVYTASQTEAIMFNNDLNNILTSNGISNPNVNVNQINIDTQGVIDAINNKVGLELNFDANGFSKYKVANGQRKQLVNNRLNIKGYDI